MIWATVKRWWEWCGSNPEGLAQLAHVGWGGFLTLAIHQHLSMHDSVLIVAAFAVLKEISEYWTETGETRGSTLADIAFWWLGVAITKMI